MEFRQFIRNFQSDYCSEYCFYCKKLIGLICEILILQSGDGIEMECCIFKCWFSLGGDWEFFVRFLGLIGLNGIYFCNYCYVIIKDFQRGKLYIFWILNSIFNGNYLKQFFFRIFELMLFDNEDFVNGGLVKVKVNRFYNCEFKLIFRVYGFVIEFVLCMFFYLFFGFGK